MKHSAPFFALLCSSLVFLSCNKDDNATPVSPATIHYAATLAGEQEVPTHSSNASGTFTATYTTSAQSLSYTLTYSAVPGTTFAPTVAHIHKGLPGVDGNATIVFDFGSVVSSPLSGNIAVTAVQLADLNNGQYYVHLHSNAFPNGDIRGQITKQ
jgi:hypothetical protein